MLVHSLAPHLPHPSHFIYLSAPVLHMPPDALALAPPCSSLRSPRAQPLAPLSLLLPHSRFQRMPPSHVTPLPLASPRWVQLKGEGWGEGETKRKREGADSMSGEGRKQMQEPALSLQFA